MAEDFGEFEAFSSAFPSKSTTTTSNSTQVSESNTNGKPGAAKNTENFFASFPAVDQPPSDVEFSFDFGEQLEGLPSGGGFGNFDVTNTNIADIHIPFDLPSPPAVDVHLAGGVPFDIPPIPLSPSEDNTTAAAATFSAWPKTIDNGSKSHLHDTLPPSNTTSTGGTNIKGALVVEDSHLAGESLNSATNTTSKVQEEDEFGDFESSLTFSDTSKILSNTQNVTTEASAATIASVIQPDDPSKESNDDSFGSFVAKSDSRTPNKEDLTFGSFESGTATTLDDSNKIDKEKKTITIEASQLADFNAFQQTSSQVQQQKSDASSDFGNFEAFANNGGTKEDTNSQFADFSAFKQASVSSKGETSSSSEFEMSKNKAENSSMETQTRHTGQAGKTNDLEFANFESASSHWDSTTKENTGEAEFTADFSAFESATITTTTSDDFGGFSAFSGQTTSSHTDPEFGDFSAAKGGNTFTSDGGSSKVDDNFGEFSSGSKQNEFGDFSSPSSAFGGFSSAPAVPPLTQQVTASSVKRVKANPVLTACFAGTGSRESLQVPAPTPLFQRLLLNEHQPNDSQGVWQVLQKCVDFTVPLHKWSKSYMQGSYYEALKVDPLLASKPGVLPILTGGMGTFEAPLGGATAAEDLMEAFGFQGDLEVSPTTNREFRAGSPGAPALLDLGLPTTPTSPTNKDSFTLAKDLLGLDLNPQQQTQALSSVEELVRNERLVVSKSTWVDSKLLEFGGKSPDPSETTSSSNSRPSTPRSGKKQNSVELQLLQLGLDVSKTTFTSGSSNGELSLSARSLLGRLPDLSFMLASEEIVHSTYYSRSK